MASIILVVHVHQMVVTYSVVQSLVSSQLQTVLLVIYSEPILCESSQGTEEHLHQTRFAQPHLLYVHGDTHAVSY